MSFQSSGRVQKRNYNLLLSDAGGLQPAPDPFFADVRLLVAGDLVNGTRDFSNQNVVPTVTGLVSAADANTPLGSSLQSALNVNSFAVYDLTNFADTNDAFTFEAYIRVISTEGAGSGFSGFRGIHFLVGLAATLPGTRPWYHAGRMAPGGAIQLGGVAAYSINLSTVGLSGTNLDRCHFAYIRPAGSSSARTYVNGYRLAASQNPGNGAIDRIIVGNQRLDTNFETAGAYDQIRFTRGVERYTGALTGAQNFTPPTLFV